VKRGRYAAGDGSLARSAGMQTARGAVLIALAVLVGVILLNTAPSESTAVIVVRHPATTTTIKKHAVTGSTTTSPPSTAAAPRPPSQVSVLVANGTTVGGAARSVNNQLIQAGYSSVGTDNAKSSNASTTAVYFVPGYQPEAVALAAALSLPPSAAQPVPSPLPVTNTKGANLVVVVGTDLASQITAPAGPPATSSAPPATNPPHTSTTVHHTATTSHATTTTVKH
jgi:hypothetical protein